MENSSKLIDDISNLVQKFKVPGLDLNAALQGRRKDVEALLEVTRTAQDTARSMAYKQADMLRNTLQDLRSVLSVQAGTDGNRVDAVKEAAKKALSNVGELAEIALKSQADAFDTVSRRARENIEELRTAISNGVATRTGTQTQ
jgi:phasin family protein